MGALKNAFKKATLTAVLATTLVAGSQSAFAQQAGAPPQPRDGGQQTEQVSVPVKPWSNDANYIRLVNAYEHGEAARERIYRANEQGTHRIVDAQYQIQEANLEQNRVNYMRSPQGMAQYGSAQLQFSTQRETQIMQARSILDQRMATEDIQHDQYVNNLDTRFANLPQYRAGAVAKPNQGEPPWVTDPLYRQQMDNLDRQQDIQRRTEDANTSIQLRTLDVNHTAQSMNANAQGINAMRQGMPGMARLGAQDEIMTAQYNMQRITAEAAHEQRLAAMEAQRAEFMFNLDVQFSQKPQYKNAVTPQHPQMRAPAPRTPGS